MFETLFKRAMARVVPPKQRVVVRPLLNTFGKRPWIVANPLFVRCRSRFKRALLGARYPRRCPTCRVPTRQYALASEKGAWRCASCGHAYLKGEVIVTRQQAALSSDASFGERHRAELQRIRINARIKRMGTGASARRQVRGRTKMVGWI